MNLMSDDGGGSVIPRGGRGFRLAGLFTSSAISPSQEL
jgi:hypothetical protein